MNAIPTIPAAHLEGMDLGNGWEVKEKVIKDKKSTGGFCSIGYRVQNKDGKEAFLKALDFSRAFQDSDPPKALNTLTELYLFERDLLRKCKDGKLDRIVTPILDGNINVPGYGDLSTVPYIIFEMASGDIRDALNNFEQLDLLWCLTSLHNVTVGINQLQGVGVAHQDVKPSNILIVGNEGSKISDLGSASDQSKASPNDSPRIPGARAYAPIDQWYSDTGVDGFEKRLLSDLYLLGSLFFFHFSGVSAVQALRSKLKGTELTDKSFQQILPYLQHAFEETLIDLKVDVEKVAGSHTPEIILIVKQLCDPDPTKRGDPRWEGSKVPKYNLQRYISTLDRLAKEVQIGLS